MHTLGVEGGMEAVFDRVSEAEPVVWLHPSEGQLQLAKTACERLFSLLTSAPVLRSSASKVHAKELLTNRFDTEQIWQQIDLQAAPLVVTLRRRLQRLESSSPDSFFVSGQPLPLHGDGDGVRDGGAQEPGAEPGDLDLQQDDDPASAPDERRKDPGKPRKGQKRKARPSEDAFLNLDEMELFLNRADDEDEGVDRGVGSKVVEGSDGEMDEDQVDFASAMEDDEDESDGAEEAKYEDFFGGRKRAPALEGGEGDDGEEEEEAEEDEEDMDVSGDDSGEDAEDDKPSAKENGAHEPITAHEKRLAKLRRRMDALERENIVDKDWNLQGEVTAARRPKNSALEIELDFEQRRMAAPIITEEVTKSIEDIIRSRILAGEFDDVQRKVAPTARTNKDQFEIDEEKSKKGLGEVYEAEYMQKSGFVSSARSTVEEQKEEIKTLFKGLCFKLDALSHFHFAPKPVVKEMGVREDVPALAMEEIAPIAVAEASLLAPEELFAGQGAKLGQEELKLENRKLARARKKRSRKLARKSAQLSRPFPGQSADKRNPKDVRHSSTSGYNKSTKVFENLNKVKEDTRNPRHNAASVKPLVHSNLRL